MTERSMWWSTNGTGHGVVSGYASDRWQALFKKLFGSDQSASAGILNGVDNELAVSGATSPVTVATGAALAHSFFYENDVPITLAITTPVVGTTGGHIILRASWATQLVNALAVRNTDGIGTIPALTQVANTTWEIRLATFTITTGGVIALTDVRKRTKFSNHVYANGFDVSAVDGVGIELNAGALRLKDLGVVTAKIADLGIVTAKVANDAIDDTKIGNRVPQFYRRQGGSATDWTIGGTTNFTPTMVRMQVGCIRFAGPVINGGSAIATVTFPIAFSNKPLVFLAYDGIQTTTDIRPGAQNPTTTTVDIYFYNTTGSSQSNVDIQWLAMGPE